MAFRSQKSKYKPYRRMKILVVRADMLLQRGNGGFVVGIECLQLLEIYVSVHPRSLKLNERVTTQRDDQNHKTEEFRHRFNLQLTKPV